MTEQTLIYSLIYSRLSGLPFILVKGQSPDLACLDYISRKERSLDNEKTFLGLRPISRLEFLLIQLRGELRGNPIEIYSEEELENLD